MQLQMTSQRYDRQQHDRSSERVPMDIQEQRQLHQQHQHQHHHHHNHHHHHQQRSARTRDGMVKAGARRLSSGPGSCDSLIGAGKTSSTPLQARRDRDDCCYPRSPPSSPRLYSSSTGATSSSITPPSSTPASSTTAASPSPRNGRPAPKLSLSIPRRLLRSEWVSLEGLVSCALSCLRKDECTGISELGRGSHNSLYELRFSDSTSCAASISNSPPAFFSADAKRSEIATMQYLCASPLYNIPVPRVYAWDLTFDNPVGAPYVLRECVHGQNMSEDGRFYKLSSQDKLKVIKELAFVQAELSKPSEFKELGHIYQREDGNGFYVGKMATVPSGSEEEDKLREPYLGPFSTLSELWDARIERETLSAIRNWSQLPSDASLPPHLGPQANPQEFGELMQLLSGLTGLFTPPDHLSALCIHHSDLAIRNVLFDPQTLKITGVIDWEFASVVPLVTTGRFPNDLGWEGNEFARSLGKLGNASEGEVWNHHYYDWTSLSGVQPPPRADMPSPPASPTHTPAAGVDYLTSPNATANGCIFEPPASDFTAATEDCAGAGAGVGGAGGGGGGGGGGAPSPPSPPSPPLPPPPNSDTPQQDLNSRAERLVELYYYRKYYASKVASRDFALTRLFMDSVAYIKFNEIVMGGPEKWFAASAWIKEVFWRLQDEDRCVRERLMCGQGVVKVPEVFDGVRRRDVDLGRGAGEPKAAGC